MQQSPLRDGDDVNFDRDKSRTRNGARPPIWHDGSNAEQKDLLSGELRITLKTLSPTLVGNHQVPAEDCPNLLSAAEQGCAVSWSLALTQLPEDDRAATKSSKSNKKFVFPLRLPDTVVKGSPVVIAGEAVRAAVRQSYAALLSAPLERINPVSGSRRPNQFVSTNGQQTCPHPAVVEKYDATTGELKVRLLDSQSLIKLEFVRSEVSAPDDIEVPGAKRGSLACIEDVAGIQIGSGVRSSRDKHGHRFGWDTCIRAPQASPHKYALWLNYHFGVTGLSGYALDGEAKHTAHPSVLVPLDKTQANAYKKTPATTVPKGVVQHYRRTAQAMGSEEPGSHWSRCSSAAISASVR